MRDLRCVGTLCGAGGGFCRRPSRRGAAGGDHPQVGGGTTPRSRGTGLRGGAPLKRSSHPGGVVHPGSLAGAAQPLSG